MGARLRAGTLSWYRGRRSLQPSLWPPRNADLQVCCIGSYPSAGKRVNAREPPIGPSRATNKSLSLSCFSERGSCCWGCGGGLVWSTNELLIHANWVLTLLMSVCSYPKDFFDFAVLFVTDTKPT